MALNNILCYDTAADEMRPMTTAELDALSYEVLEILATNSNQSGNLQVDFDAVTLDNTLDYYPSALVVGANERIDILNVLGTRSITVTDDGGPQGFGQYIAANEGIIAVGAYLNDEVDRDTGKVYVYDLRGNPLFELQPSGVGALDLLGATVDIGNGKIAAGARGDDDKASSAGAVWLFDLDGSNEIKITPSDGAQSDLFGQVLKIGNNKIVVASKLDDDRGSSSGAVYIYDLDGTNEIKIVPASITTNHQFGYSIDCTDEYIIIGTNPFDAGDVYIYDYTGTELLKLDNGDSIGFGAAVAINGNEIAVLDHNSDLYTGHRQGAVFLYTLNSTGTSVSNQRKLLPPVVVPRPRNVATGTGLLNHSITGPGGNQAGGPADLAFSNDGMKTFVVWDGSAVLEIANDEPYNISLLSLPITPATTFFIGSETTAPRSIEFDSSGTKMFILVFGRILLYTLNTAFDLSTASYSNISYSLPDDLNTAYALRFSSDGTKFFVTNRTSVFQFSLSVAFDITSTVSLDGSFYTGATLLKGLDITDDGHTLFVSDNSSIIRGYYLPKSYDFVTESQVFIENKTHFGYTELDSGIRFAGGDLGIENLFVVDMGNDRIAKAKIDYGNTFGIGTRISRNKVFVPDTDAFHTQDPYITDVGAVHVYNIDGTFERTIFPDDPVEDGRFGKAIALNPPNTQLGDVDTAEAFAFNSNGTKLYLLNETTKLISQFTLSPAYDISSATFDTGKEYDLGFEITNLVDMSFNSTGTRLYVSDEADNKIYQYTLGTAYDISTATYNGDFVDLDLSVDRVGSFTFNNTGSKLYITDVDNSKIVEFGLSSSFDITTATTNSNEFDYSLTATGNVLIRFNSTGSKLFFLHTEDATLYEASLSSVFNISTATTETYNFTFDNISPVAMNFNPTGDSIFLSESFSKLERYSMESSFSIDPVDIIDGASSIGTITDTSWEINPRVENSEFFTEDYVGGPYIGAGFLQQYDSGISYVKDISYEGENPFSTNVEYTGFTDYRITISYLGTEIYIGTENYRTTEVYDASYVNTNINYLGSRSFSGIDNFDRIEYYQVQYQGTETYEANFSANVTYDRLFSGFENYLGTSSTPTVQTFANFGGSRTGNATPASPGSWTTNFNRGETNWMRIKADINCQITFDIDITLDPDLENIDLPFDFYIYYVDGGEDVYIDDTYADDPGGLYSRAATNGTPTDERIGTKYSGSGATALDTFGATRRLTSWNGATNTTFNMTNLLGSLSFQGSQAFSFYGTSRPVAYTNVKKIEFINAFYNLQAGDTMEFMIAWPDASSGNAGGTSIVVSNIEAVPSPTDTNYAGPQTYEGGFVGVEYYDRLTVDTEFYAVQYQGLASYEGTRAYQSLDLFTGTESYLSSYINTAVDYENATITYQNTTVGYDIFEAYQNFGSFFGPVDYDGVRLYEGTEAYESFTTFENTPDLGYDSGVYTAEYLEEQIVDVPELKSTQKSLYYISNQQYSTLPNQPPLFMGINAVTGVSTELKEGVDTRAIWEEFAEDIAIPNLLDDGPGTVIIDSAAPNDGGTWISLATLADRDIAGNIISTKYLWKKIAQNDNTTFYPPLKLVQVNGNTELHAFDQDDINSIVQYVAQKLHDTGIGSYGLTNDITSPPDGVNSWTSQGSFVDTRSATVENSYVESYGEEIMFGSYRGEDPNNQFVVSSYDGTFLEDGGGITEAIETYVLWRRLR